MRLFFFLFSIVWQMSQRRGRLSLRRWWFRAILSPNINRYTLSPTVSRVQRKKSGRIFYFDPYLLLDIFTPSAPITQPLPAHPGASRCEPWKIGLKKVFKKSGSSRNGCYWLRAPSILLSAGMWLQVASVHFGQRLDFLWTNLCTKSEI